jgi:hypothetical protein
MDVMPAIAIRSPPECRRIQTATRNPARYAVQMSLEEKAETDGIRHRGARSVVYVVDLFGLFRTCSNSRFVGSRRDYGATPHVI